MTNLIIHTLVLLLIIYLSKKKLSISLIIFCLYFWFWGKDINRFKIKENYTDNYKIPDIIHISEKTINQITDILSEKNINNPKLDSQLNLLKNFINKNGDIKITRENLNKIKESMKDETIKKINENHDKHLQKTGNL